jgi:hypothetical protein
VRVDTALALGAAQRLAVVVLARDTIAYMLGVVVLFLFVSNGVSEHPQRKRVARGGVWCGKFVVRPYIGFVVL